METKITLNEGKNMGGRGVSSGASQGLSSTMKSYNKLRAGYDRALAGGLPDFSGLPKGSDLREVGARLKTMEDKIIRTGSNGAFGANEKVRVGSVGKYGEQKALGIRLQDGKVGVASYTINADGRSAKLGFRPFDTVREASNYIKSERSR